MDEETIYQITSTAKPEEIREFIKTSLSGDFAKARGMLDDLLLSKGLSGDDVVVQIHRALVEMDLPDKDKARLIDRIGEADFRMTEGANERIQLEALLAYFASAFQILVICKLKISKDIIAPSTSSLQEQPCYSLRALLCSSASCRSSILTGLLI